MLPAIKMRVLLILTMTFLVCLFTAFAKNGIRECGSTYYSSDYKPTIVNSLNQLPLNIKQKLISFRKMTKS